MYGGPLTGPASQNQYEEGNWRHICSWGCAKKPCYIPEKWVQPSSPLQKNLTEKTKRTWGRWSAKIISQSHCRARRDAYNVIREKTASNKREASSSNYDKHTNTPPNVSSRYHYVVETWSFLLFPLCLSVVHPSGLSEISSSYFCYKENNLLSQLEASAPQDITDRWQLAP